jgi:hypothetical protein
MAVIVTPCTVPSIAELPVFIRESMRKLIVADIGNPDLQRSKMPQTRRL